MRELRRPGLHRQYGHNIQGADATYVVHGVKCIFPLPDALTFEDGALVDPASIALHVANRGNITLGDTVAITGAGAIGLLAGDAALIRGAARVIVVGRGQRLAKAAALGFETVDSTAGDPVGAVRAMTDGLGADVVLECAGVPEVIEWALEMLRRGGRCAAVGIPTQGVEIAMQKLVLDELELVGSRASAGEMRRVIPHVEQGRMRVRELVTHRFALADYADALATFNDRASGAIKIIVAPEPPVPLATGVPGQTVRCRRSSAGRDAGRVNMIVTLNQPRTAPSRPASAAPIPATSGSSIVSTSGPTAGSNAPVNSTPRVIEMPLKKGSVPVRVGPIQRIA